MEPTRRQRARKSIAYLPSPDEVEEGSNKENRASATTVLNFQAGPKSSSAVGRKQRSKSLGVDGLGALQAESANRQKIPVAQPKSILKPSIPLSPLRPIPARKPSNHASPGKGSSSSKGPSPSKRSSTRQSRIENEEPSNALEPIADFAKPHAPSGPRISDPITAPLEQNLPTEDDTDLAHMERKNTREELIKQRDARRKSLANRRVSFAPEATLHTWDMIEDMQDSTTSSAATNPSRRISEITTASTAMSPNCDRNLIASDASNATQSAVAGHVYNESIPKSPVTPRPADSRKQNRRASGTPPAKLSTVEAEDSSSPDSDVVANILGEMSMDLTNNDMPISLQPWMDNHYAIAQEPVNPFSPAFKKSIDSTTGLGIPPGLGEEDASMDITCAVGSIVMPGGAYSSTGTQNQSAVSRRQSTRGSQRRLSVASAEDSTMDFTTAIGGIQAGTNASSAKSVIDKDEDLSMELTSVFHATRERRFSSAIVNDQAQSHLEMSDIIEEDVGMDMTVPLGRIVRQLSGHQRDSMEEHLEEMDITQVFGTIHTSKPMAKDSFFESVNVTLTSATPNLQRAAGNQQENTANATVNRQQGMNETAQDTETVPAQMLSPTHFQNLMVDDGASTPQSTTVRSRSSPHLQTESIPVPVILESASDSGPRDQNSTLSSDRRRSLAANHTHFVPSPVVPRRIHFEDPVKLAHDVSEQREDEERRESGRFVLEKEVDSQFTEKDATTTLKEAMENMTPKKRKLNGRKSLAKGGAKGLLGTRPVELDQLEDENNAKHIEDFDGSPRKRLKTNQWPRTPSALRTSELQTDTFLRQQWQIFETPKVVSSMRDMNCTPKSQGRFVDAERQPSAKKLLLPTMGQQLMFASDVDLAKDDDERIPLSEFLNLINIRFIDINTTKRRHTVLPAIALDTNAVAEPESATERLAAVGSCTLPLLELFQHSCRELRKYIAEGRTVIRAIEDDAFNEEPPIFKQYLSASPTSRTSLDHQFRNIKAQARLLSKGMWYEWRMKLLDGLNEGLMNNSRGLSADDDTLSKQERILGSLLPTMDNERSSLDGQCAELRAKSSAYALYNTEEMTAARGYMTEAEEIVQRKRLELDQTLGKTRDLDTSIQKLAQRRDECLQLIERSQVKQREQHKWSAIEIDHLKADVGVLSAKHGWTVTAASSGSLTMVYRDQLQLFFHPASFKPSSPAAPAAKSENGSISLTYVGNNLGSKPQVLTTERRFFLQLMRAHLQCVVQRTTYARDLLRFVSGGWDRACSVADEVQALQIVFDAKSQILDDEHLHSRAIMFLPTLETKVHVSFAISASGEGMELQVELEIKAKVIYGEKYKEDRMGDFLMSQVGKGPAELTGSWVSAVKELKNKLMAQGRKG